jgi:RNA polymerase sigma factor (sigma-70 family)
VGVSEHSDVVLLRQALAGTKGARKRLVERVGPLIEARVQRSVARERQIGINGFEDVAQQVWLRLFDRDAHRLVEFDPARGTLEGYISKIAQSVIADLLKHRTGRAGVALLHEEELPDPSPSPEDRTAARQLARRVRDDLMAVLPVKGQLVLKLLYDDFKTEHEAAEIMGVSLQVVANWKHKIKTLALDFRKKYE